MEWKLKAYWTKLITRCMYLWQTTAVSTACQKLSNESMGRGFFVCFVLTFT